MNTRRLLTTVLIIAGSLAARSAGAQQVRVRGHGEPDVDQMLRAALAAQPLIVTRDTLIRATDTIKSNIVVVRARFIVEGTIVGDLTGIESNIYLRPNAHVTGTVLNVAGGLYPSELAKVGKLEDRALSPYHLVVNGSDYEIQGDVKRPKVSFLGATPIPEYNRVDGLRVGVGPSLLLPSFAGVEPIIGASIGYATERKDVIKRAEVMFRRARSSLVIGWDDDITLTNEEWIRSGLNNSLSVIFNGKDYRNYYAADRTYVEFRRVLEVGERTSQYWIRGQNESARSLVTGDPWMIFKPDSLRYNDPITPGRISSLILGARTRWTGLTTMADIKGHLEFAGRNGTAADFGFNAYAAEAFFAMKGLANHTLKIDANFQGPLPGTDALPLQRWTFVGGSGTLYTHRLNQFRGDRLAFIESEYRIPFAESLKLPVLGLPTLRLMYNTGMAWSHDAHRDFEQNIGARLQFSIWYIRYITNPARMFKEQKISTGLTMPAKAYPWEKKK